MTCASCGAKELCLPCKGVKLLTEVYERHAKANSASREEASAYLRGLMREHPEMVMVVTRTIPLF